MLPQTPSEVHGRVYDRGILYLHNHTPSHVAAAEQLAADALEQLLKPISLAEYPTTYGPKDIDPFVPLVEEAKDCGDHNALFPAPKADPATKAVLRNLYEELKKREGRSLADRLKADEHRHFLPYLQPLEPLLSRRAIREGEVVTRQNQAPSSVSQLFLPRSKYFISGILTVEPMPIPHITVEDALDLRWSLDPQDANGVRRVMAAEKQKRRMIDGVWDRWDNDTQKQDIPKPISLNIPLFHGEYRFPGKPDFHAATGLVASYPHLSLSKMSPTSPMEVISLYWMDIGVDCWELNPRDSCWLDEFDDAPFSDLSELVEPLKTAPAKPKPPCIPRREMMERPPEVEDWSIDTPLVAWRHSDATQPMDPPSVTVPRTVQSSPLSHFVAKDHGSHFRTPQHHRGSSSVRYQVAGRPSSAQTVHRGAFGSLPTPNGFRQHVQPQVYSSDSSDTTGPYLMGTPGTAGPMSYPPQSPYSMTISPSVHLESSSSDSMSEISKKRRLSDAMLSSEPPTPAPASRAPATVGSSSVIRLSQFSGYQGLKDMILSAPSNLQPTPPTSAVAGTSPVASVVSASDDRSRAAQASSIVPATPLWIQNPVVRNPDWYSEAAKKAGRGLRTSSTLSALCHVGLLHHRTLSRALTATIKLCATQSNLQGADLVLSTRTAVIFLSLQVLKADTAHIFDSLKRTAVYYNRVIVVFEALPYGDQPSDEPTDDPLDQDIVSALPRFRRKLEAFRNPSASGKVLCVPDIVVACSGAAEVAGALYVLTVNEHHAVEGVDIAACLDKDPQAPLMKEEERLITNFGFNAYAARLILAVFGSLAGLLTRRDEARLVFGELLDETVWARFQRQLNPATSATPSNPPINQPINPTSNPPSKPPSGGIGRMPPTPTAARHRPTAFRLRPHLPSVPSMAGLPNKPTF